MVASLKVTRASNTAAGGEARRAKARVELVTPLRVPELHGQEHRGLAELDGAAGRETLLLQAPLGWPFSNYLCLISQKDPNYQIIILRTPGRNFMRRWEQYRVAFLLNTTLKSFTR